MVSIPSLWVPIVLSAVLVFVVSSIIHMFLTYHASDFSKVEDEDGVMDALRGFTVPPGDYVFPHAGGKEGLKSDAFREKVNKGPVAFFTVVPPGAMFDMRKSLVTWFLYCVLVGVVAAYLGGRMLGPGDDYLAVFRVTGTVAFCCYAMAHPQRSIWFHQKWSTSLKSMFDGLVYASLTAGMFGWLWPS
jgi:hypothetical protein